MQALSWVHEILQFKYMPLLVTVKDPSAGSGSAQPAIHMHLYHQHIWSNGPGYLWPCLVEVWKYFDEREMML